MGKWSLTAVFRETQVFFSGSFHGPTGGSHPDRCIYRLYKRLYVYIYIYTYIYTFLPQLHWYIIIPIHIFPFLMFTSGGMPSFSPPDRLDIWGWEVVAIGTSRRSSSFSDTGAHSDKAGRSLIHAALFMCVKMGYTPRRHQKTILLEKHDTPLDFVKNTQIRSKWIWVIANLER